MKYLNNAYNILDKLGDKFVFSQVLYDMCKAYLKINDYYSSKYYLDRLKKIASEYDYKKILMDTYKLYSEYYSHTGDYKTALDYYVLFHDLNNNIFSKENSNKLTELQIKYEINEKEKENEILRQKTTIQELNLNRQSYILKTVFFISMIVLLLIVFVLYRFWLKKRVNKTLIEINKMKDKLLLIITHDLKNPFGSLVSLSSFLNNNFKKLDEEHKFKGVESIKESIDEIYALLINLTEWIKAKDKNIILSKADFNISTTISYVLNLYKTTIEQKSIKIQTIIDESINVYADERMIKTVMRNLIDNAVKFSHPFGIITIKTDYKDDRVIISISDTGTGIKDNDKEKLFNIENHFSTLGTNFETGSGLGLILSKEFIEKNDGQIWYSSEFGKGSTFYFSITKSK